MLIPMEVSHLDCDRPLHDGQLVLRCVDGSSIHSRTVVIATGARYRRPDCAGLKAMEGNGVRYWGSPIEAKMCAGQEVIVVGGGNSAGQAVVFLAGYARKIWMLVRSEGLAASMSQYLIDRIASIPNIELRTGTEILGVVASSQSGIESVTWRRRDAGKDETRRIRNVFLFLGAEPSTEWLQGCNVTLDEKGFVRTGLALAPGTRTTGSDAPRPLETNVHGIFAVGEVRLGSVKRVGGAIGEGAAVVAQIHAYLEQRIRTLADQ